MIFKTLEISSQQTLDIRARVYGIIGQAQES